MTRRRRLSISILGTLLLLYVVVFWCVGCADYFILHPTTEPIAVKDGKRLVIPFEGKDLEVWTLRTKIRPTEDNAAYVLELIPNAGRAEYAALYGIGKWEGKPIEYWSVNYPGYGGSDGPATLAGVHGSALAAYDALAKLAGGKPIFVYGYSLGTAAGLYVAANRPVAGIFLYNPPPIRQMIMNRYGWWNLWLAAYPVSRDVPSELDSLANGRKCIAPAFFALGKKDSFVGFDNQLKVFNAYAGPKRKVELNVDHNDDPEEKYRDEIRDGVDWLWDQAFPGKLGS
jgi:hypothetical protein